MAKGSSSKSSSPQEITRKRVEAESVNTLKRARDGSAFTKCEACNKNVPVVLIDMHSCSLDSKIRMTLEAQVVEKVVETKKPTERKRASPSSEKKEKSGKKGKKTKDPSKPKRPPTAFFLFMDDFRKKFKEENPDNKSVAVVAKEGGEKWKSMTEEEKKPYIEKSAALKAELAAESEGVKENDEENVNENEEENVDGECKEEDKEESQEENDEMPGNEDEE